MRKLLLTRKSECVQPIRKLIAKQKHRTLVLWTIDCSARILPIFEKAYPKDKRPREAVKAAKDWAQGKIKMPVAKKAALASHKAATAIAEENPAACAAARAMGHVVGTVHVETHALGIVFYGLTAFVYAAKQKNATKVIAKELKWMYDRLLYWQKNITKVKIMWTPFLLRDDVPNKEALLMKKGK